MYIELGKMGRFEFSSSLSLTQFPQYTPQSVFFPIMYVLIFLAFIKDINAEKNVQKHYSSNSLRSHRNVFTSVMNNNSVSSDSNKVLVNKCCERFEIQVDSVCQQVNETEYFQPLFKNYNAEQNTQLNFKLIIGLPNCGSMQMWPIFHYKKSSDQLVLLEDGKLRHYTHSEHDQETDYEDLEKKALFHDYEHGQYCIDKAISTAGENKQIVFAYICLTKKDFIWTDTNFLFRKLLNPIFHGISLVIFLFIAITYFILPTLRDLVGNIISTIAICLMVTQAADLVRIFTDFTNHVSFIVADIIFCTCMLASFFWLNSFGYYIWKTFRSRNVFLRITDGRKYCYYSFYAWGCTSVMAILAVFSHFFLDADSYKKQNIVAEQETMGWLGIAIFFAPIACTIIINIFFYVTTIQLINRRNVYGRIQHKLKANFVMYGLMLLIMSISWMFLVLSWLQLEGLQYAYIVVNAILSILLLYVCILRQKHVMFLLKKTCCYNQPPSSNDWGDEMSYMRCNDY